MRGTLNQKKAIKRLVENGWTQARGGKHQVKMTKPTGLSRAILKQAGLK